MAVVMSSPVYRVFDRITGRPVSGAKIYTFDEGDTRNPRSTFKDVEGTVEHTNPIITDAYGYAVIFWKGNYMIEVKDADDNLIYTVDGLREPVVDMQDLQEWRFLPDIPTYVSGGNVFSVTSDRRQIFHIGKRIRLYSASAGYMYGTVTDSVYSTVTTVTVQLDTGTLDVSLTSISESILSFEPSAIATPFIADIFKCFDEEDFHEVIPERHIPLDKTILMYVTEAPLYYVRDTSITWDDKGIVTADVGSGTEPGGLSWVISGLTHAHTHGISIDKYTEQSDSQTPINYGSGEGVVPGHKHRFIYSGNTLAASTTTVTSTGAWRFPHTKWLAVKRTD